MALDTEMIITGNTRYSVNFREKGTWLAVVGVVVSVVLNVALLVTVGVIGHEKSSHHHTSCDSPACVETAARVAGSLNTSHPACSDFYEYSCGGYKLHHNVEDGQYGYNVWDELTEEHAKRLRMSLESADKSRKYGAEAAALFESCMDLKAINQTNSKPLLDLFNVGGPLQFPTLTPSAWKIEQFDLAKWITALHQMDINVLFTLTKGPNPLKPSDNALKVYPSGTNMHSTWYYTSDDSFAAKRREEYQNRMIEYIKNLGANTNLTQITSDVKDVLNFEIKLAKITPDWRLDIYNPQRMRLRRLYKNYIPVTRLDWEVYIKSMYPGKAPPNEFEDIFIEEVPYFKNLSKLIAYSDERTIANYMGMSLLYNLADHLPEHISGRISAHKRYDWEASPLYKRCALMTEKLMPWAAVRTMLDKNLLSDKTSASAVFDNIKTELLRSIDAVSSQLSDGFTAQLKSRATHLKDKIGYPDWVLNTTTVEQYYSMMKLQLDPSQYLSNVMVMARFGKAALLLSYEEQFAGGAGWDTYMGDYEAAYYLYGNAIYLPVYYLAPPVYSQNMPDSFNYGGIGAWLGYYMVYALEDDYKTYVDEKGAIVPLNITKADRDAYESIKNCNNYIANVTYLPPGTDKPLPLSFDGGQSVVYQHNDIIATRASYKAFKSHMRGSQTAPSLPESGDKVFYLAVGQFYCSARYDHSSYYHKLLNAIAASSSEFTAAFGCQSTDYLYNSGSTECYL